MQNHLSLLTRVTFLPFIFLLIVISCPSVSLLSILEYKEPADYICLHAMCHRHNYSHYQESSSSTLVFLMFVKHFVFMFI